MKKNSIDQPFHYKSKRIDISGISPVDRRAVLIDITGFWIWRVLLICIPLISALLLNKHENKTTDQLQPGIKQHIKPDTMRKKITLALVDDHTLFRLGLSTLLEEAAPGRYNMLFQAASGIQLMEKLASGTIPELLLLDINMPEMDGIETARLLAINYPSVKVLVLSMLEDENAVLKMLKHGVKSYLLKETTPGELIHALNQVHEQGQFFPEWISNIAIRALNPYSKIAEASDVIDQLNSKELQFLKLVATEMNYQEMADQMGVSYKSIDKYRESIFSKFNVKSRVGLIRILVKNDIINKDNII
ncbi:response regulator transcription factor [Pedobacter sp. MR2016-19]|uniref:response regulator transcription factor n=1 Tax=Pedobacter sp. MR2016-19 TaxID=2780089 RepID=UPI001874ABD2|nr:response regulator transcription factor [Pedobacter sp. MR2016-19]MBE5321119.1 response regulator transcription factor [Pedobacter sp. MR2016-19]